jgi:hypothetical protein
MSETRTEKEIIAEAYSEEAAKTWRAPVQRYPDTIPWPIHLEAYAAYVKRWSTQTALIDLKGRHCRGGFGAEELDLLVPGWRDRVSYVGRLEARVSELEATVSGPLLAEAVRVKPLMWPAECARGRRVYGRAKAFPGFEYCIAHYGGDVGPAIYRWAPPHEGWSEPFQDYDTAKSAANSHYESRVLSSLADEGDGPTINYNGTGEDAIKQIALSGSSLSALAPQAGDNAEEPVAWRWRSEIFTEWNVSDRDPISQENMERETEMNMRGLEIQPLYTHPCPSTPVVSQNAPDLQDKGGETVTLLARVAAIICEETCGLTSACKSREAARSLLDKGYLSAEPKIAANVAIRKAGDAAVDKLVDRFALTHFMPDSDDLADHLRSIVDACVRAATEKPE